MGDRWIEKYYFAELSSIYTECEREENSAKLLSSLLECTFEYLENDYLEDPTELKHNPFIPSA